MGQVLSPNKKVYAERRMQTASRGEKKERRNQMREKTEAIQESEAITMGLEDTEDLVTSDKAHLGDTVRVTEGDTDLRGGQALTSKLNDVINDVLGGSLEPCRRGATIREGRGRYMSQLGKMKKIKRQKTHKCPCRERACDPF